MVFYCCNSYASKFNIMHSWKEWLFELLLPLYQPNHSLSTVFIKRRLCIKILIDQQFLKYTNLLVWHQQSYWIQSYLNHYFFHTNTWNEFQQVMIIFKCLSQLNYCHVICWESCIRKHMFICTEVTSESMLIQSTWYNLTNFIGVLEYKIIFNLLHGRAMKLK